MNCKHLSTTDDTSDLSALKLNFVTESLVISFQHSSRDAIFFRHTLKFLSTNHSSLTLFSRFVSHSAQNQSWKKIANFLSKIPKKKSERKNSFYFKEELLRSSGTIYIKKIPQCSNFKVFFFLLCTSHQQRVYRQYRFMSCQWVSEWGWRERKGNISKKQEILNQEKSMKLFIMLTDFPWMWGGLNIHKQDSN